MKAFFDEVRANLRSPVVLAAWGFLTAMMALAGPFGSYEQIALPRRLIVWLGLTAMAIVLATAVRVVVYSRWQLRDFWRGGSVTSALSAAILAPVLRHLAEVAGDAYLIVPPGLVEIAVFVFCLTMGFCAFRHALETVPPVAAPAAAPAVVPVAIPDPALPRLADRLPEDRRGPVLRISGRDHYVEVATPAGATSLLMRFSDALAELDGVDGLQVHRSHWVAAGAVAGGGRDGAKVVLRLTDGGQVPVSRTHLAAVQARGWLDQT